MAVGKMQRNLLRGVSPSCSLAIHTVSLHYGPVEGSVLNSLEAAGRQLHYAVIMLVGLASCIMYFASLTSSSCHDWVLT